MTGVAPSVPTTHIDPTAGGPREVELKYAVSDLVTLRAGLDGDRIGSLRAGDWRLVEVEDRYLDTAAGALKTAGYGVRLRYTPGGASVLTVKSSSAGDGGANGALHDRLELEAPAGPRLDPTTWPQSEARAIVERITDGERLRTLFVVHQRREERPLSADGSDAVAATLTLDAAEVRLRGRVIGSFDSLEVESADGSTDALNEVARALESTGLIEAERRNKEEIARGYVAALADEAAREAALRAAIPKTPGIGADDPLAEAGRKVLRLHFLRMLASEPGTRRGDVVEPLHKMRVATRRMRAVWRVFDGAYKPRIEKRSVARLRTVATALGVVRDLDVQLEALAAHRDTLTSAA
ncbi:MAG: CHAD domain-containing protein, partial [Candidatus Limnocylindrales bacterium]